MKLSFRYDLRAPAIGAPIADLYRGAIDQAAWADRIGGSKIYLGEHHAAEDGYLCAPIVLASAMAAVTTRIRFDFSALVVTLHDPLRLAEDLATIDIISRGRAEITAGMGYRPHEFEMFGIDPKKKVSVMMHVLRTLKQAWTGEPFEHEGRTVRVTPKPYTPGGPHVVMGGSADASAIRAAREGYDYAPAGSLHLYPLFEEECRKIGRTPPPQDGGIRADRGPSFLHVTDDPDRDWPILAPYIAHTTNMYAEWAKERALGRTAYVPASTVDDLKASGQFLVVTPEECLAYAQSLGRDGELTFQPLIGGLPPALAQQSLDLFERAVLPRLKETGLIAADA